MAIDINTGKFDTIPSANTKSGWMELKDVGRNKHFSRIHDFDNMTAEEAIRKIEEKAAATETKIPEIKKKQIDF